MSNSFEFGAKIGSVSTSGQWRVVQFFRKIDGKSVKKRALLSARNVQKCRVIAERSRTVVYR
ncbi:hypothetical protein T07_8294 [Trichinella nelsoni]|uniref:Uncharacterized protein n=1 Tax=Trichinella nelsoni TaxID=6336 RepID=A0A0V0S3V8_9BILA|nr:hypothetical protein T07_8294 [Trichinella nelsoni]